MTKFHFYFIMLFICVILVRLTTGFEQVFYFTGCVLSFVCGVVWILDDVKNDV